MVGNTAVSSNVSIPKAKKKSTAHKIHLIIAFSILAFLAVAGAIYFRLVYLYQSRFFAGTTINHIDASDKTPDEIEQIIGANTAKYQITLNFRDGKSETLTADELGYKYVPDGSIRKLLSAQNAFLWPAGYFSTSTANVSAATAYDEDKLQQSLNSLPEMQDANMQAPENAYLDFQNNAFTVVPETAGTTINKEVVAKAVSEAVSKSETSVNIDSVENAYQAPTVFQDNAELNQQANEMNALIKSSITYQLPGGETQVLDGNTMKDWLGTDENGHYYKDDDKWNAAIKQYVSDLEDKVCTVGKERKFNATGLGEITVKGGKYGWSVDESEEIKQLTEELNSGTVTTREPVWVSREVTTDNNGFGSNYIEVDLSRQHMWVYQNGQVTLESDVVSGRLTKDRYTPSGIYTLTYKQKDRDLKGPVGADGQPSYVSHVNYWMPFNRGIGFHDATWRSNFGGSIYVNSGSHGCVNLPTSFAPKLYDVITDQMPIVLYYSNGCKFES